MKKTLFFVLMLAGFATYAQTAQSVSIDFNKARVPGASIIIAGYDADFVQSALTYRLEKVAGLKGTNSKGFRMYPAQNFLDFGNKKYDIYTLVDKGDKKNPVVTLNLLVSTGNENFVSPTDDADLMEKMKEFLDGFNDYMKEYDKVQKIDNLTNLVNKLDKERNTLVAEVDKLKKDIATLENKLREKEATLSKTESDLESASNELNSLKK